MKEHLRRYYKLYLFFLFLSVGIFLYTFIYNKGIFIFDGDTYQQTFKYYLGGWEKVHSGTLSTWDWSLGFGGNIFSYTLYFISSPVFWFCTLFPKEFIPYSLLIANILQLWLGLILTYHWLQKLNKNSIASIVGAITFIFCGWNLGYMRYELLLIATVFYPLSLYYTEVYLEKKKFLGLCISLGLLGISNYLLLYQFIPFLCLYTLMRYLNINKNNLHLKNTVIESLKFFSLVILGVLLSSIILLPTAFIILNMPRFSSGDNSSLLLMNGFREIFKIYSSLYTPVLERQNVNFFIEASQHGNIGWGGGASLYSMIITPLLLPLMVCLKDKFKRNSFLLLEILGFIFFLFPFFSKLFNFSIDTRWLFMLVLINTIIISSILDSFISHELQNKYILFSFFINLLVLCCIFFISYYFKLTSIQNLTFLVKSSFVLILIMLLYTLIIYKNKFSLLLVVLAIEVLFCGVLLFKFNTPLPYTIYDSENYSSSPVQWIKENDQSFYRILYDKRQLNYNDDLLDITAANEPLAQDFKGMSFYSSLYNVNQEEYLGRFKSTWLMSQLIGRENSYNLLSAKYFYSYAPVQPVPFGYELIEETSSYKIYKNENFLELGYVCPNTINSSVVSNLSYLLQDQIMQKYCVTNSSPNITVDESNLELLISFADAEIRILEFDKPISSKRLYIENFGIPHLEVRTYFEEREVDIIDLWQFNYSSIVIDENQPIDKLVIIGADEYGYGTMVNVYEEDLNGSYENAFNEMRNNSFTNVSVTNDIIKATINVLEDNKTIFTSVPIDAGWNIYVDNKKIEYEEVNFGFIGFNLDKGIYDIRFEYTAPLFREGIYMSISSLILLVALNYFSKRKRQY